VPLPGDAIFVAHLSGSLSRKFGMHNSLEFEDSWHQDDGAVCQHMKTVDPSKQKPIIVCFLHVNKRLMHEKAELKWRRGSFSPSTSVSPANLHSTNCSTIILFYHLGFVQ
jgi:hypothetical protein